MPPDQATYDSPSAAEPILRISPRCFARMARFVTAELGIKMPESKVSMIQSRLLHRVRQLGLASLDDYCEHLFSAEGAESERFHFVDAITTNKTDFFREPAHFSYLTQNILPQFRDRRISLWSAACSSGEEPYTLAMVLSEFAAANPPFDFRILATDISTKVLQRAKEAIYSKQSIAPIPSALCRKYLLQSDDRASARITPALRRHVSFHRMNFMDPDYPVRQMFEVVFCRNVLIYFDRPTQQAVISKLCRNLIPGGYLFVSHSESLSGLDLPLDSLGASCFRKQGSE